VLAKGLLGASHPLPSLAVTVLATALSAGAGRSAGGCVLVAAAVLSGQLSIGWCNDLVDRARDVAAGRRDKPLATGAVSVRLVTGACALAVVLCVPLSLASGWRAGVAHLAGVAGGWAYDLGLKRTPWSFLPYAVSFALLAAFITLGLPGHPAPPAWLLVAAALLGTGAHFLNVVPDVDADLAAGVRGLPQRMGAAAAAATGAVLLAAAAVVVTFGPGRPPWWAWTGLGVAVGCAAGAGLTGAAAARGGNGGRRTPFLLAVVTAAVAVALLVARVPDLG
jgi:4-hydroxybenzoate polyprenyltransferase